MRAFCNNNIVVFISGFPEIPQTNKHECKHKNSFALIILYSWSKKIV